MNVGHVVNLFEVEFPDSWLTTYRPSNQYPFTICFYLICFPQSRQVTLLHQLSSHDLLETLHIFIKLPRCVVIDYQLQRSGSPHDHSSLRISSHLAQCRISRPIRWILALHGDVVIPFTIAGLISENIWHGL